MCVIRKLHHSDYFLGYLELLSELSPFEKCSYDEFIHQFNRIHDNNNIFIYVIESNGAIVANGTLIIEDKFIHKNGRVGHIEDIVVHSKLRGQGFGEKIVNHLVNVATESNCYKIILDCKDELSKFYGKMDFFVSGKQMRRDLFI